MELKEDRSLFARLLLASKSPPEINLEDAVGRHELSVVPRSMISADGEMLHCHTKSNLMVIPESLPDNNANLESDHGGELSMETSQEMDHASRIAVVDGMAEVQSMGKPDRVLNCSQLADHVSWTSTAQWMKCGSFSTDMMCNRNRRLGSQTADSTNIAKISLRLLSHGDTKKELTGYLADKMLQQAHALGQSVVVAWGI